MLWVVAVDAVSVFFKPILTNGFSIYLFNIFIILICSNLTSLIIFSIIQHYGTTPLKIQVALIFSFACGRAHALLTHFKRFITSNSSDDINDKQQEDTLIQIREQPFNYEDLFRLCFKMGWYLHFSSENNYYYYAILDKTSQKWSLFKSQTFISIDLLHHNDAITTDDSNIVDSNVDDNINECSSDLSDSEFGEAPEIVNIQKNMALSPYPIDPHAYCWEYGYQSLLSKEPLKDCTALVHLISERNLVNEHYFHHLHSKILPALVLCQQDESWNLLKIILAMKDTFLTKNDTLSKDVFINKKK